MNGWLSTPSLGITLKNGNRWRERGFTFNSLSRDHAIEAYLHVMA
jgi:hypothetical protein